jgi:hypothetical protein
MNYPDVTIHKKLSNVYISIFRKLTFTDPIPYPSNHPTQQIYAAIRFLYNRINFYQLHEKEY